MVSKGIQKKIAVINDMSGYGRCSIAVSLPVISKLKVQCCPVPTAIFSNHTGYEHYFFDDYTEKMPEYIRNWKLLGLEFSGIYSGFLGSDAQIDIVENFIRDFRTEQTLVIIDPVMGDYGKAYATFTPTLCKSMKRLVQYADILTPNLTEACILTDTPYKEKWRKKEIRELAVKLMEMGPSKVVITGIVQGSYIANYVCDEKKCEHFLRTIRVGTQRCGTGDLFASIIAADAVNGVDFAVSVKKASNFVKKCIEKSMELEIPVTDGVAFEEILDKLR
ncbi:MAG: pyridoxamine kinase [Marvinbryantia sp.]|uniref:pyridoxamine kinase n=2 Tax=Marvinbryantia sp. TaxID=2496532 RepID=UPI0025E0A3A8|nr:pyridoxamine kinase [uncultured Marvinbryantia sp.]